MLEDLDTFKLGKRLSVTLKGNCTDIKNGSELIDNNGNVYKVLSVGMTRFNNPSDISQSTTILIMPCDLKKGVQLYKV